MRRTERQGEEMKPELKYCGNHQKHRPDARVIVMVEKILADVGKRIRGVSAVVDYDDDRNRYTMTLAWEGKVFVTIFYISGRECCEIGQINSHTLVMRSFEIKELIKEITPFLLDLLKKEKHRINEFLNCALGA